LVQDLVARAFFMSYEKKPGVLIQKLKGEDAEIVKTLTADDFQNRIV
jgi:hypothetical protein